MTNKHNTLIERLERAVVGASVRGVEDPSVNSHVEKITIGSFVISTDKEGFEIYDFDGVAEVGMAMGSGCCTEEFKVKGVALILKGANSDIVFELRLPATEPSCIGVEGREVVSS